MATLYVRTNGKEEKIYYANYVVEGRRVRRKLGKNKKLAGLALKDLEVKLERQELGFERTNDKPLKKFAEEYLEYVQTTWSPKTYKDTYKPKIGFFLDFVRKNKLSQVTSKDIEDFKLHRLKKVSESTVAGDLIALKAMFNWGIAQGYLRENPCKNGTKLKKTPKNPPRFLSREEAARLLSTAKNSLLYSLVATALYSGLRKSELVWLEWTDIDLDEGIITVRNKEGFRTKNSKSRTVPLSDDLKEALLPYRKDSGWCFPNSQGSQYKNNLLRDFKVLCEEAGIENCHLHTLRHTFASHLVMDGVSIYKVSQWLGHSDVTTTMIYAHLAPQDTDINRISFKQS